MARPLRIAVHGILADGAGSGAGSFPVLFAEMLERGHRVEFFGNPGYVRPRSLERFPGYRFHPLRAEFFERLYERAESVGSPYLRALVAQINHAAYHREAVVRAEALHAEEPYDFMLFTDTQALWPSRMPVVSWPQSPPQTEATALLHADVRRSVLEQRGAKYLASVQAFYAYRALTARAVLSFSDLYLCGSVWARDQWARFGAPPERLAPFAYPIALSSFAEVPRADPARPVTFLWLGRATPRKRLDLFLEGFARLRARHPTAQARVVGVVVSEPLTRALVERYRGTPGLVVEPPVARAEIPALFANVNVLVQPSEHENFGFSLAEALAAGRLVVAGSTNGTLEYAGRAGFGFASYTPESVANAMARALEAAHDPALFDAARAASGVFRLDVVADRFCDVCEDAALRARSRGKS